MEYHSETGLEISKLSDTGDALLSSLQEAYMGTMSEFRNSPILKNPHTKANFVKTPSNLGDVIVSAHELLSSEDKARGQSETKEGDRDPFCTRMSAHNIEKVKKDVSRVFQNARDMYPPVPGADGEVLLGTLGQANRATHAEAFVLSLVDITDPNGAWQTDSSYRSDLLDLMCVPVTFYEAAHFGAKLIALDPNPTSVRLSEAILKSMGLNQCYQYNPPSVPSTRSVYSWAVRMLEVCRAHLYEEQHKIMHLNGRPVNFRQLIVSWLLDQNYTLHGEGSDITKAFRYSPTATCPSSRPIQHDQGVGGEGWSSSFLRHFDVPDFSRSLEQLQSVASSSLYEATMRRIEHAILESCLHVRHRLTRGLPSTLHEAWHVPIETVWVNMVRPSEPVLDTTEINGGGRSHPTAPVIPARWVVASVVARVAPGEGGFSEREMSRVNLKRLEPEVRRLRRRQELPADGLLVSDETCLVHVLSTQTFAVVKNVSTRPYLLGEGEDGSDVSSTHATPEMKAAAHALEADRSGQGLLLLRDSCMAPTLHDLRGDKVEERALLKFNDQIQPGNDPDHNEHLRAQYVQKAHDWSAWRHPVPIDDAVASGFDPNLHYQVSSKVEQSNPSSSSSSLTRKRRMVRDTKYVSIAVAMSAPKVKAMKPNEDQGGQQSREGVTATSSSSSSTMAAAAAATAAAAAAAAATTAAALPVKEEESNSAQGKALNVQDAKKRGTYDGTGIVPEQVGGNIYRNFTDDFANFRTKVIGALTYLEHRKCDVRKSTLRDDLAFLQKRLSDREKQQT